MSGDGPVNLWRQRLNFDDDELAKVEEHTRVIEQAQREAELALAAARTQFEALTAQLSEITARRDALRTSTSRLRAKLAAHACQRLPLEVLRDFFLCMGREADPLWMDIGQGACNIARSKLPFVLAAVCRRWRNLALSTSALWTYIAIPVHSNARAPGMVSTLLHRSSDAPLDILLPWDQSRAGLWTNKTVEGKILGLVSTQSRRWRRFELRIPKGALKLQDLGGLRCPTPLLEELSIAAVEISRELEWSADFPTFLPFAPKLRLFVSDICNVLPSVSTAPLQYLSTLHLRVKIPCSTLWSILRLVPNAECLFVHLLAQPPDAAYRLDRQLELPHLREFHLCASTCSTLVANANEITLPALYGIRVYTTYVPALLPVWQRVNRTLRKLSLRGDRVGSVHLEALRPLRGLHELRFWDCAVTASFLDALAETRDGEWDLPALERIEIQGTSILEPENCDSLFRLLRARRNAPREVPGMPTKISTVKITSSEISHWVIQQVEFFLDGSTYPMA